MIILAINTASSVTGVALLQSDGDSGGVAAVLAEDSWTSTNNEAEKLMPSIDDMLSKTGKTFADLDGVFAVSGPGSFTGLRIGVTTANTIAYLLGCKLYALNTFEFWHGVCDLPVLIFAGKGGVYLSEKGSEIEQLTLEELPKVLQEKNITAVCGDISEEQKLSLGVAKFTDLNLTFGESCSKILLANLKSIPTIKPLYVKDPAITISQKNILKEIK